MSYLSSTVQSRPVPASVVFITELCWRPRVTSLLTQSQHDIVFLLNFMENPSVRVTIKFILILNKLDKTFVMSEMVVSGQSTCLVSGYSIFSWPSSIAHKKENHSLFPETEGSIKPGYQIDGSQYCCCLMLQSGIRVIIITKSEKAKRIRLS